MTVHLPDSKLFLAYCILQSFTGSEYWDFTGRNLNLSAGLRVTALTSFPFFHFKTTKANQLTTFTYNTSPVMATGSQAMAIARVVSELGSSAVVNQAFNASFQYAYSVDQIKRAYGIDQVIDGGHLQDGTGITIAVLDPYDTIRRLSSVHSDGSWLLLSSDLHQFDLEYGLPEPAGFFTKVDAERRYELPGAGPAGRWAVETAVGRRVGPRHRAGPRSFWSRQMIP